MIIHRFSDKRQKLSIHRIYVLLETLTFVLMIQGGISPKFQGSQGRTDFGGHRLLPLLLITPQNTSLAISQKLIRAKIHINVKEERITTYQNFISKR